LREGLENLYSIGAFSNNRGTPKSAGYNWPENPRIRSQSLLQERNPNQRFTGRKSKLGDQARFPESAHIMQPGRGPTHKPGSTMALLEDATSLSCVYGPSATLLRGATSLSERKGTRSRSWGPTTTGRNLQGPRMTEQQAPMPEQESRPGSQPLFDALTYMTACSLAEPEQDPMLTALAVDEGELQVQAKVLDEMLARQKLEASYWHSVARGTASESDNLPVAPQSAVDATNVHNDQHEAFQATEAIWSCIDAIKSLQEKLLRGEGHAESDLDDARSTMFSSHALAPSTTGSSHAASTWIPFSATGQSPQLFSTGGTELSPIGRLESTSGSDHSPWRPRYSDPDAFSGRL